VLRHRLPALVSRALAGVMLASAGSAWAQTGTDELKRMSLEDLLDVEVTTLSRRPEPTTDVPAAIFVITQDDIRRSGATSLPEALRLAPGMQVAQIDGGKWATGVRGFSDRLSRAMLVLIDGRAVYSPLFAGTYWEVQETMLEDVERIEVIRGPGGTLWGANAVNGIVNIITRGAAQTQGVLATAEAGTYGQGLGAVRYGGSANNRTFNYRFYGKGLQRPHEYHATGTNYDDTTLMQGGGRADWSRSSGQTVTLQGDVYGERLGQQAVRTSYTAPFREVTTVRSPLSGGNVLARWSGGLGATGQFQLQTYYDRTNRDEVPIGENRDTFDVDFQHSGSQWRRHQLAMGAGYRVTSGRITAVAPSAILPETRTDNLFSAFVQDSIPFFGDRFRLDAGAKVEHNSYSGFEVQPSGRLLWTPRREHTLFLSATRAVRTPSRVETDYTTTSLSGASPLSYVRLEPNPGFRPEELVAYEAGYRLRLGEWVYATASGFYNSLNDILSTELVGRFYEGGDVEPSRLILPVMFRNGLSGESHGTELTADLRPLTWFRTTANYSYLKVAVTRDPGAVDVSQERRYERITPRHQLQLQASIDLPHRIAVDWLFRSASSIALQPPVPSYATSTIRVGWQVSRQLEIAVVGQDLNQARHVEWPGALPIQRSGFVKVTWRER
jgi:iron complex outermembrane receptor protein